MSFLKNLCIFSILCVQFYLIYSAHDTDKFDAIQPTTCEYRNSTKRIKCNSTIGSQECEVFTDRIPQNFTFYGISELKATNVMNPLIWFRLYPKKLDGTGWWYFKLNDLKLSIHSRDRVAMDTIGFVVLNPVCWSELNMVIRSSDYMETIKTERINKDMFTKPFEKVRIIGTLSVLD